MKKNNKNEHVVTTIMYIIIAIVVFSVIFVTIISNKNLLNNKTEDIKNDIADENDDNKNTEQTQNNDYNNTQDTNDDINISKAKLDEIKQNSTTPIETQVATYTTTLYDKEETRIENINLAISKLNGVTIENGSEFSFNNTIRSYGWK